MNQNRTALVLSAAVGALGCFSPIVSLAQENRFYIKPDIGAAWTLNTDLKDFLGAQSPGSDVKFDTGYRFGLAAGYQVTKWFSAEGEVGLIANNIRSITDATRVDAWYANVPFLVNAKLRYPNSSRFSPYIGAGVGVASSILDVDKIEINGTSVHGSDADAVFAYQGFAGVRYALSGTMGLSLEYRFFGAESPTWDADITAGAGSDEIRFGRTQSHSVSLAFDWNF
jgi:opacity protein-like surface antigen